MSFPDPIELLIPPVRGLLPGFVVAQMLPKGHDHHKSPSVVLRDDGGPGVKDHVLDQRRVTFLVEHTDPREARDGANRIREYLHDFQGGPWWWVADTSSVYFLPDYDVSIPRYGYTARINVKDQ